MTEKNKVIGFTEFFGKVDAIVVKDGKVQLKEYIYENDAFGELLDRDVAT